MHRAAAAATPPRERDVHYEAHSRCGGGAERPPLSRLTPRRPRRVYRWRCVQISRKTLLSSLAAATLTLCAPIAGARRSRAKPRQQPPPPLHKSTADALHRGRLLSASISSHLCRCWAPAASFQTAPRNSLAKARLPAATAAGAAADARAVLHARTSGRRRRLALLPAGASPRPPPARPLTRAPPGGWVGGDARYPRHRLRRLCGLPRGCRAAPRRRGRGGPGQLQRLLLRRPQARARGGAGGAGRAHRARRFERRRGGARAARAPAAAALSLTPAPPFARSCASSSRSAPSRTCCTWRRRRGCVTR